jgi:DNA replication protein DnaC
MVSEQWVAPLLQWEEDERGRCSLERRIRDAHLGSFKPLCDFDWAWPKQCDRATVEELMALEFVKDTANVVLIGPNGVGKSTLALNLAYQAIVQATPLCSRPPARCLVNWQRSTAILRYVAA